MLQQQQEMDPLDVRLQELVVELLKACFHICKTGIAVIPTVRLPGGMLGNGHTANVS